MTGVLIAPWRFPKLDRIGEAMGAWSLCRCPDCRREAEKALRDYDRGRK